MPMRSSFYAVPTCCFAKVNSTCFKNLYQKT